MSLKCCLFNPNILFLRVGGLKLEFRAFISFTHVILGQETTLLLSQALLKKITVGKWTWIHSIGYKEVVFSISNKQTKTSSNFALRQKISQKTDYQKQGRILQEVTVRLLFEGPGIIFRLRVLTLIPSSEWLHLWDFPLGDHSLFSTVETGGIGSIAFPVGSHMQDVIQQRSCRANPVLDCITSQWSGVTFPTHLTLCRQPKPQRQKETVSEDHRASARITFTASCSNLAFSPTSVYILWKWSMYSRDRCSLSQLGISKYMLDFCHQCVTSFDII